MSDKGTLRRWIRGRIAATVCVAVLAAATFFATGCGAPEENRSDAARISRLVEEGHHALTERQQPDSALLFFTRATSLYSPQLTSEEKEACVRGYVGKWIVCYAYLFDYPQAYEALQRAMEICESADLDKSHVEVSMGGMLQMLAEQSDSEELYDMAANYYTSGLHHAIASGRLNDADRAFVNLMGLNSASGLRPEVRLVWPEYSRLKTVSDDHRRRIARTMYGTLTGSLSDLNQLEAKADSLPVEEEYTRLRFIAYETAALTRRTRGDLPEALRIIRKAHDYATERKILDGEIEAMRVEEQLLRTTGAEASADSVRAGYLMLKESLLNSRQISRLNELRFLADLRHNAEQIESMQSTMNVQVTVIILFVILGLVTGSLLWMYLRKNRSLRKANDTLYRNLREQMETATPTPTPPTTDDHPSADEPDQGERTALINAETVGRIMAATEEIMKNPDTFCTPDFSLSRLADLVGYNSKYVAYAIKESAGCNFSAYVNRRRVLEACGRMIQGGQWQQFTLEAVAHAVGFKSRSSFLTAFKQHTGITPSEFKRRADNEPIKP